MPALAKSSDGKWWMINSATKWAALQGYTNATKTTKGTETGKVIFTMIPETARKNLLLCRCY
jgi:hypothetical protein